MLEALTNNPIVTIISLALAVLGIVLTIKSKQKLEFSWAANTNLIVENKKSLIDGFEMLFNGVPVDDLSVTKIAIWNSGNKEIVNTQMYSDNKLRIVGDDTVNILQSAIVANANEDSKFETNQKENVINIDFECAEKKDGIVVQIIHSGNAEGLQVYGKIHGGRIIDYEDRQDRIKKTVGLIGTFLIVPFLLFFGYDFLSQLIGDVIPHIPKGLEPIENILMICFPLIYLIFKFVDNDFGLMIPNALESIFNHNNIPSRSDTTTPHS